MKNLHIILLIALVLSASCNNDKKATTPNDVFGKANAAITYCVFDDYDHPYYKIKIDTAGNVVLNLDSCGHLVTKKFKITKDKADSINECLRLRQAYEDWQTERYRREFKKAYDDKPSCWDKEGGQSLVTLIVNNRIWYFWAYDPDILLSFEEPVKDSTDLEMGRLLRSIARPEIESFNNASGTTNDEHWFENFLTVCKQNNTMNPDQ